MRRIEMYIVLEHNTLSSFEIWNIFINRIKLFGYDPKEILNTFRKTTVGRFTAHVKKKGFSAIHVEAGPYKINTMEGGWGQYQHILIESTAMPAPIPWPHWIEAFRGNRGFLQAWVHDREFVYWQGVDRIETYEEEGRDHSRLPKVPTGYSPPHDVRIDVSGNSSRLVLRKGVVEAIGNMMWLGEGFWERSGARKQDVLAADWAEVREEERGIVFIKTADDVFTEDSPVEVQHRLRKMLYPRTWNIPDDWGRWDGWIPVGLPSEDWKPAPWQGEKFPIIIERRGERDGKPGVFRLTRKSKDEAVSEFIPDGDT